MLNSNKPIESSYLEKLANQSIFNDAFMIEMISTFFVEAWITSDFW